MKYFTICIILMMAALFASAAASCAKPDDWDDELDGAFDPERDCNSPHHYNSSLQSGHDVLAVLRMSNTPECYFITDCYDEFGTVLGDSRKCQPVECARSCDCYNIAPVFDSLDAVQNYKLEVLRASLVKLQGQTAGMETRLKGVEDIIYRHKLAVSDSAPTPHFVEIG